MRPWFPSSVQYARGYPVGGNGNDIRADGLRRYRASAIGVLPLLKSIVCPIVVESASTYAATAATSSLLTELLPVPSPVSIRPVPGSSVSPLGPRIVQSRPVVRRCSSAEAFASAYGKNELSGDTR